MRKPVTKLLMTAVFAGIVICLSFILMNSWRVRKSHPDAAYLLLLREAYASVAKSYVEQPDSTKLVQSMVTGMLASLDPHSAYLPPEPYKEMEVQMSGAFGGVGIELGMKEGRLTVTCTLKLLTTSLQSSVTELRRSSFNEETHHYWQ